MATKHKRRRKSDQGKKHILSALSYADFLTADFFEQITEVLAVLATEEGEARARALTTKLFKSLHDKLLKFYDDGFISDAEGRRVTQKLYRASDATQGAIGAVFGKK